MSAEQRPVWPYVIGPYIVRGAALDEAQDASCEAAEGASASSGPDGKDASCSIAVVKGLPQAAQPLGVLVRGEGGAFSVRPNMDALLAIYAMPPGEHPLYARGVASGDGGEK